MRYAQIVMGPAGSGKSTYCSTLAAHGQDSKRTIHVANLDPAAEHFSYQPLLDVRDLIQVDDVMEDEEMKFGPNGGLVFSMEFMMENTDWLEEALGEDEDDYILFDCPGQIELYTHMNLMRRFVDLLQHWNFRVCGVFLIDSHFMVDGGKFISGALAALSVMVNLEVPHVNVLSKIDLLSVGGRKQLERFLEPDTHTLTADLHGTNGVLGHRYGELSVALGRVLDDYSLVKFFPLDITSEENIQDLLIMIDTTIQYGEDLDTKTRDFEYPDKEDENDE
ncbi:GPN-loop GTPase 3-like [Eurytemora carolleeae]|uniref:GPN-loop GTPase 3-like n=1 Tax=Eurytemora carolleeae TaxID=1294199 RepID=UPI000C7943CD|nr:GPN-loop GTPase 3-like [Eurytemora carolleeae]XP_023333679.1 GPN-loop GTPase 3-like [Eurytemora carolleeae]XP_023333680.1 GPN-loop GTPase 3-like [Eurytemora carolleeae]|eukprot:XP_023333678.1 GPN-loop GTPase 3-like [Eurytemora affinis]